MIQKKLFGGISIGWLLIAGIVWAVTGNLSSCSDLPQQIYFRPGTAQYFGVSFKNDTAVHSASWNLQFVDFALTFDNTCANGRVKYASEVASHGCSTSDVLSGDTLTVSISGCTTPLPTRTDHSGLFAVCYKPIDTNETTGGGLDGTCTAQNNSSGAMNCSFSFKETTVADVFMSTSIPASVSSNSGQVRVASFRLGTDELLYSAYFSIRSDEGNIEFVDTSNATCCSLLRGGGGGCPDTGPNVTGSVADTTFPVGCTVFQSDVSTEPNVVFSQVNCSSGMTQASKTSIGIVKFCYRGVAAGADQLIADGTANPFSSSNVLAVNFPDQNVTVTP